MKQRKPRESSERNQAGRQEVTDGTKDVHECMHV
uniref:Uncharacterized protein n=1 Tax=Arundo donax TaxID=35708 RepID=A0A0A9DFU2_ARUDO